MFIALVYLIRPLVYRYLYSVSIGVYTLSFIPCFMLIPYLDSF